jgi:multidrug resistance efflux pump
MNRKWIVPVFILCLLVIGGLVGSSFSPSVPASRGQVVAPSPFAVWTFSEGQIESRRLKPVIAQFNGSATVVELTPEGSLVKAGDLLVRFDASQLETDLPNLERDYTLAKSELESLEFAQLPLEMQELKLLLLEARFNYEAEREYLKDNQTLREEDLVSEQEVKQQELKVEQMKAKLDQLEMKAEMTEQYLHPSQLERARAKLDSARRQLDLARAQIADRSVTAPSDGLLVYWPLHVAGEFRTIRVGDTLYRNQSFMALPDMSDLVVNSQVPESELSRVAIGNEVVIIPLAFPDVRLRGRIQTIGSTAQMLPGRQPWQKFFRIVIALEETHERLRTGMSVNAQILSYQNEQALLVPRSAVWWEDGVPYCRVRQGRKTESRRLTLGQANSSSYEALAGLNSGDFVVTP